MPSPLDASVVFLQRWCGLAPRVVTALHPDHGYIRTRGFAPGDNAALRAFIAEWRGSRNLYFQVNQDMRQVTEISSKSRKEHIGAVVALHVDIDTYKDTEDREAGRARVLQQLTIDLPPGIPGPPSVVLNSGNGTQAFWRLREPVATNGDVAAAEAVERFNRGIAQAFGGDSTTDITRIMRLPGSINWPNERKRGLGLVPVLARQVSIDTSMRYELEQFPAAEAGAATRRADREARIADTYKVVGDAETVAHIDVLDVSDRAKAIIQLGQDPTEQRASRSEWVFAAILAMLRAGEPDTIILGVLLDPRWGISESVLEKPDPETYARRQIARAHARLGSLMAEEFGDE